MALPSGARLGPFEIVSPVGAGGMGEVYRALDTRLKRTVAIKVIAGSGGDESLRQRLERFQQEARAIARINHPGICALHDVGQEGETTYLVMEFVAGEPLSERLATGPLPLPVALRTAGQIADALDHAHRQGVTHRDLKPANIMLTREGVKILDFGLAKLRDDPAPATSTTFTALAAPLTEVGTIVGTLPYMSPEQVEGRQIDARSDIFSFGVVLYEMVTGRRPFAGDSRVSLMAAIIGSDPPAPSTLQTAVSPAVDRLIARCLAKDPEDRWQDARDLSAALRWLVDAAGSGAGAPALTGTPVRSRRWLVVVAGFAGAALAAAGFALTLMLFRSTPSLPTFNPVTFQRGIVTAARFAPDGQTIVYSGSWNGAPHDVLLGQARSSDARSLQLPQGRILAVSKTGDLAVHVGQQAASPVIGTLSRMPLVGGARRERLERVIDADWIPGTDELAVAIRTAPNAMAIEFPIGTRVHESRAIWSLRVSPDGSKVAFFDGPAIFSSATGSSLMVLDRSGRKSTLATGITGLGLAWTPSGREVWYTAGTGASPPSLFGASLAGKIRSIYRAPDWIVLHDIATDGRVLMSRNSVRIALTCQGVGESGERDLTWLMASQVTALARDGTSVVFAEILGGELGVQHVHRRMLDGSPAVLLGTGTPQGLSPDGKWVLVRAENKLSLLPAGAGSAVTLSPGKLGRILDAGWLDNVTVAFTGLEGRPNARPRIFVQSIKEGLPRPVTPEGVVLAAKAPTPDGKWIFGLSAAGAQLFPLAEGSPRPVPGLAGDDQPLQWSRDGQAIYVVTRQGPRFSVGVFRIEVTTGRRTLWKVLTPSDPVGVDGINSIALTPDASAYCYSPLRRLGDLFVVEGLR